MFYSKSVCVLSLLAAFCFAEAEPFRDGDTVVFFGDSITHHGPYLQYLANFYRTRYPERKIRLVNSGTGGDTASGALKRLPEDVAEYAPTCVALHFGMNDVNRGAYTRTTSAVQLRQRAEAQANFRNNLTRLVQAVKGVAPNARFIYLTTTPYDDTAVPTNIPPGASGWATVNQVGCNGGLAQLAGHILAKAQTDGVTVVDWFSPLNNFVAKRRANNPHFMVTKWDRVHPGPLGHSIMAWSFLRAQHVSPVVSDVALNAATGTVEKSENAVVTEVAVTEHGLTFTLAAKSLPFPVVPEALGVIQEFNVEETLNREVLAVKGLQPGEYALTIDGTEVGSWTADAFAKGIRLGFNPKTPQYAQAQEVAAENARLWERECAMRNHHSARWFYFGRTNVDDVEAFAKWIEEKHETGYFAQFVPGYVAYWPHYREARAQLLADQEKVYAQARPKPHRYAILRKP